MITFTKKQMTAAHEPNFTRPEILQSPNVPAPLSGTAPRVLLGQRWWDAERAAAMARNNNCCWACGLHKTRASENHLQGHETYKYEYWKGRGYYTGTAMLCPLCHQFIHSGLLAVRLEAGEISAPEATAVVEHGLWILGSANLSWHPHLLQILSILKIDPGTEPLAFAPDPPAPWSRWRLIVLGQIYEPIYATQEEWEKSVRHARD